MSWQKLPVTGDAYRNVDETQLDAIQARCQDFIVDELGHSVKRPGLSTFVDLGTGLPVDGIYWWDEQGVIIAVSGGRIWKITDFAGTKTELTAGTGLLASGTRVTFAVNFDGSTLATANGGKIVKTTLAGPAAVEADGNAPTTVSHVAFIDGYILANQTGTNKFWWPAVNTFTWSAANFASANAAPDNLTALHVGWREILLVGPNSVEVWFDDGVTPFTRLQGGFTQRGCSAPYSVQQVGNNWMWLDEKRRFVKLDNRTPTVVSTPFNKQIQGYSIVSDATSDVMEIDGYPLYVVSFPNAGKTLVYHYLKDTWMEWGAWSGALADYKRFMGQCYAFARNWNLHLVGDSATGIIYKCSRSLFDDNGSPMRSLRRTGWVSHGTYAYKRCAQMRIRCKRNAATATVTNPSLVVRWRDDMGAWGNDHIVSLGVAGDNLLTGRLFQLGRFRMRQWEFIHSDNSDCILVDAEVDIDGLDVET